ncbi:MAG: hypothetical protein Q7R52_02515 [archaeon]|nr:hypothetical protein [archaeon]
MSKDFFGSSDLKKVLNTSEDVGQMPTNYGRNSVVREDVLKFLRSIDPGKIKRLVTSNLDEYDKVYQRLDYYKRKLPGFVFRMSKKADGGKYFIYVMRVNDVRS